MIFKAKEDRKPEYAIITKFRLFPHGFFEETTHKWVVVWLQKTYILRKYDLSFEASVTLGMPQYDDIAESTDLKTIYSMYSWRTDKRQNYDGIWKY